MRGVRRRGSGVGIVAGLAIALCGATVAQADVVATVGSAPFGRSMPPGFIGVSLEYQAVHVYTGRDPRVVNPVLVELLRDLAPGQAPVLRIGGDSTDSTWWPLPGVIPPGGISYGLNNDWLRTTRALADALGARLIMGINLAGHRPALAAAEARAIVQGIGSSHLDALEIGNEPDLYGVFPWYRDRRGGVWWSRSHHYGLGTYLREFSQWRAALPAIPLAGPSFSSVSWMPGLGRFLAAEPGLGIVTFHRYPLRGCLTDTTSPSYASIANLLSDRAAAGLAHSVASYATVAHSHGLPFRLDEMNSASCTGRRGVSDTFASALWALDALFNMASVGVDGVNLHSLPNAGYELFTFSHQDGVWRAFVHPEYYALLMFAQAFPPGAQLLPVSAPPGPVKVWATRGRSGTVRIVVINKDPANSVPVQLQVPDALGQAQLEWLRAPSVDSTTGVTLGGRTFGPLTTSGQLSGPGQNDSALRLLGTYSITLPPASAVMLTQ
jgi:glycosyl hydrolase family 79